MPYLVSILTLIMLIFSVPFSDFAESYSNEKGVMIFYRYQFQDDWGKFLDKEYISGARTAAYWAEINSNENEYNWDLIDNRLNMVKQHGKKMCLTISLAGYGGWLNPYAANGVPQWVYDKGEGTGKDYLEWQGPPYTRYPIFWCENIKQHYETFIDTLGKRYDHHPDLAYVIIGLYPEMNLGKDADKLKEEWLAAGFTPELYKETVKWYIDLYAKNFTHTTISLANLSSKPLSSLNNNEFNSLRDSIADYLANLPNGGIENNALRDASSWDFIQQYFRTYYKQTHIVYEAVDKSDLAGGRAGNFKNMIENGLTAHADHFQIYYEDILLSDRENPNYRPEYEEALQFAARNIGIDDDNKQRNTVWIRFNALNNDTGSKKFYYQGIYCDANAPNGEGAYPVGKDRPGDGQYLPVSIDDGSEKECIKTNQAEKSPFIYLDINDEFSHRMNDSILVYLEYLDKGTDNFCLEYFNASKQLHQSSIIKKYNTDEWKSTSFYLSNVLFDNQLSEENDIRIDGMNDGDEYIGFFQVSLAKNTSERVTNYNRKALFYPNPTEGLIYINNFTDIKKIELYNSNGSYIKDMNPAPILNLNNLPLGIYFMRMQQKKLIYTTKIVLY